MVLLEICNYFKNMENENTNLEYRLKQIDKTKNYFSEEVKYTQLISKKYKNTCETLNYVEHLPIFL